MRAPSRALLLLLALVSVASASSLFTTTTTTARRSLSGLPAATLSNPQIPSEASSISPPSTPSPPSTTTKNSPPPPPPAPPSSSSSPPPPPPPAPSPQPSYATPWLPQCSIPRTSLSSYAIIASPASSSSSVASSSSSSSLVSSTTTTTKTLPMMTASTAATTTTPPPPAPPLLSSSEFFAESPAGKTVPVPMPLPMVTSTDDTDTGSVASAAACSSDAAYSTSPAARAAPTVCMLTSCFNGGSSCYTCSGTFVVDPTGQGRLLFLTASHCAALAADNPMHLPSSYVNCNRAGSGSGSSTTTNSDGVFRTAGVAISNIDFARGYGVSDGALIQLAPLSNTNVAAYAIPMAVGAVTSPALASGTTPPSSSTYSGGFPQVVPGLQGCTLATLGGDAQSLHYARSPGGASRVLTANGIAIEGVPGCGGNSGGALVDEGACVLYGVLTATLVNCAAAANGGQINTNFYSRIVLPGSGLPGVPLQTLASVLAVGQAVFV